MEESIRHFIHNEVNNKLHLLHRTTPKYFTKLQQTSFTLLNYIISHLHQTTPYPTFIKLNHIPPSPNYTISHLHQTTSHYSTPNHTARHYTDYTYFTKLQHITPNDTPFTKLYRTTLHRITPNYNKLHLTIFVLSKLPACFKSQ